MKENKQQCNLVTIIASLISLYLSGSWMAHELKYVSIKQEFNLDISWLLQAPLMLFIATIFIVSLMLLITYISEFRYREFLNTTPWKKVLVLGVIFNLFMIVSAVLVENNVLTFSREFVGVFTLLFILLLYIFGVKKQNINFIFFLVSLVFISAVFLALFLYLRYDFV